MGYIKMRKETDEEYDEEPMNNNSYMNSYGMNPYNNGYNNSYDNSYARDNMGRFTSRDNREMDRHYPPMPYPDRRW